MKSAVLALAGLVGVALLSSRCVSTSAISPRAAPTRHVVHVQGRWLGLRVSRPLVDTPGLPFVLFVTGDGGWRGKDLDAFRHLTEWGYPVAGISAPEYLDHFENNASSIHPSQLAGDLATILDEARDALAQPPGTPALLVGVSRGADLVVVAAARPRLRASIAGVMAIALTKEEEYVRHRRRSALLPSIQQEAPATEEELAMAEPYVSLTEIPGPVCLVQSTNDQYVRAAEARVLFGPESPTRRFRAISSRDHSFSDARAELYDVMRESLDWLAGAAEVARNTGERR